MLSKGTQDFNTGQAYPIRDPQVRINVLTCVFAECLIGHRLNQFGGKFCYSGGGARQTGGRRDLQADVTTRKECINLHCTCGLPPHSQHQIFILVVVFHLCSKIPNTGNLREEGCFNSWFQSIQFIGSWLHASASCEEEPCGRETVWKKGFLCTCLYTSFFQFYLCFQKFFLINHMLKWRKSYTHTHTRTWLYFYFSDIIVPYTTFTITPNPWLLVFWSYSNLS